MDLKDKILELRSIGLTYNQIKKELNCSKGTISYHCGIGQKEKAVIKRKRYKSIDKLKYSISKKVGVFNSNRGNKIKYEKNLFLTSFLLRIVNKCLTFSKTKSIKMSKIKTSDVLEMLKNNSKCSLTGKELDIQDTRSWHLDHIVPVSRGGENTLDNCQITSKVANQAKSDLLLEEFLELCKSVLEFHNYKVEKLDL